MGVGWQVRTWVVAEDARRIVGRFFGSPGPLWQTHDTSVNKSYASIEAACKTELEAGAPLVIARTPRLSCRYRGRNNCYDMHLEYLQGRVSYQSQ